MYGVCGHMTVGLLTMLERCGRFLIDVLIEFSPKGGCHHLYAATDAEDGYLAIGGKAHKHQLMPVTGRVDTAKFAQGFLTEVERIDVTASREDERIHPFEQAHHGIGVITGRYDEWCTTSLEY